MKRRLVWAGAASAPVYLGAMFYGAFRPGRIESFLAIFGLLFLLYAVAVYTVLRGAANLWVIAGFAVLFNLLLLPTLPTLSDDMYRYVWDGRVQAAGINPYRFPSNAPELQALRDNFIWPRMNRPSATTIYPPGAEMVFALIWRLVPDSILFVKLAMLASTFLCGGLLVLLLRRLGEDPARVLIFLWSPLLIFEVAQSAHVDALYLPLVAGAMLVRVRSPVDQVRTRDEILIGILLGAAVLIKLYPAILLPPLWSIRTADGRRRWRPGLPLAAGLTVAVGYALYIAPGVDTLGFLPNYTREFFNLAPPIRMLVDWAPQHGIDYYKPVAVLFPLSIALVSLYTILVPARSARQVVQRCAIPIGITFLISQNLFSWYVLWMLPLVTLDLCPGWLLGFKPNAALAWWVFSGLVALSYTLFITGYAQPWASWAQFVPVYGLLGVAIWNRIAGEKTA